MRAIFDAFDVGFATAAITVCCLLPFGVAWVGTVAAPDMPVADMREIGAESIGDQEHGWISFTPVVDAPVVADAAPQPEPAPELEVAADAATGVAQGDLSASDDDGLADADPGSGVEVFAVPAGLVRRPGAPGLGVRMVRTRPEPTATASGGGGRSRKCIEPSADIRDLGDGRWEVERTLVDYYATHIRALDALGFAATHKDDAGKHDGFRIGGMRCGNALHQSGFRNGDVVHKVNGRKVNTIPQAIAAYFRLRGKSDIEVELTRKGQPKVLRYRLVKA